MASSTYFRSLIFCFVLCFCLDGFGQARLNPDPQKPDSSKHAVRELILTIAKKEIGVTERTGRNDHPRIVVYHRSVSEWLANYKPAQPYCASFVNYVLKAAGVKVTGVANPARARDWFTVKKRIVLTQQNLRGNQRMIKLPEKGCLVGYIFYGNAISHVEILDRIDLDEGYVYCVGANTSAKNAANTVDREGQGVYYVKRKIKMFYAIADVI
ncbi:hypothetical protein [Dyadobacter diqingensis]|uniref:hypothetical protein n=1 Tax=Dyadobacter diqingensis TaxID=2938121 RepID=UPI0020C49F5E|nr:hypothetical protein [Dyadobacter diqingensis]